MPKLLKSVIQAEQARLQTANIDRVILWDSEVKGFGCRITRNNAVFYVQYADEQAVKRRATIGSMQDITVEAARKQASIIRLKVRAGEDPAPSRKVKGATVADLANRWLEAKKDDWRPSTLKGYTETVQRDILPHIGQRPLAKLRKADLADFLAILSARSKSVAALTYRTLSSMLNYGEAIGLLEAVPLPKAAAVAPTVKPRERLVTDAEIKAIWAAADQLRPRSAALARWYILSAMRKTAGQAFEYGWLQNGVVHVPGPMMKSGKPHQVPLSPWALEVLQPALEDRRGPFVFSDDQRPPNRAKAVLDDLHENMGRADWSWHDLRRSFRTWCSKAGISRDAAETALAHTSHRSALDKAYDLHSFTEEANAALLAWQEHVQKVIHSPPSK